MRRRCARPTRRAPDHGPRHPLSTLRDRHPAWRLLASPHAPLEASFLHRVFVAPNVHDLARLTPEEAAFYDDHRFDRHQSRLRLEQERVGFEWLCDRLAGMSLG